MLWKLKDSALGMDYIQANDVITDEYYDRISNDGYFDENLVPYGFHNGGKIK